MTKIYVAASSHPSERERAKLWMAKLRAKGIEVVSDWLEIIDSVGDANPRGASREDRQRWALHDIDRVSDAHLLWFLAPGPDGGPARGAYFELGFAYELGLRLIASGDTKQSIFSSLAREFATDEEAFDEVCALARLSGGRSSS